MNKEQLKSYCIKNYASNIPVKNAEKIFETSFAQQNPDYLIIRGKLDFLQKTHK